MEEPVKQYPTIFKIFRWRTRERILSIDQKRSSFCEKQFTRTGVSWNCPWYTCTLSRVCTILSLEKPLVITSSSLWVKDRGKPVLHASGYQQWVLGGGVTDLSSWLSVIGSLWRSASSTLLCFREELSCRITFEGINVTTSLPLTSARLQPTCAYM